MKINSKFIQIIYAGTQGTAGLYLKPILDILSELAIPYKAYVSYYYPFDKAKKYFFRYTDLANLKKKSIIRPYLRYTELCFSLFNLFIKNIFKRPAIINYSINSSYFPEYLFLKGCKYFLKIPILLTCHDVVPFANANIRNEIELKRRKELFHLADYLLVHNEYSKQTLIRHFDIDKSKIVYHSFPFMDLNILNSDKKTKVYDFLFIGHLRKEKGIEILLEAWHHFHNTYPNASLCIAGNVPKNNIININQYKNKGIDFILNYINDETYIDLIKQARCVILPYTMGTNSGIPSSVISVGSCLITSDLPMFQQNSLLNKDSFFEVGNSQNLLDRMTFFYLNKIKEDFILDQEIINYKSKFKKEVIKLYSSLLLKQS